MRSRYADGTIFFVLLFTFFIYLPYCYVFVPNLNNFFSGIKRIKAPFGNIFDTDASFSFYIAFNVKIIIFDFNNILVNVSMK